MALSDFTNPKNPWKIKDASDGSHCHVGEEIGLTLTLTCSESFLMMQGRYDKEKDRILFPNGYELSLKPGENEKMELTYGLPDNSTTGSWMADDSGNTGDGE